MSLEAAWLPAQIRWTAQGPLLDWCHLGDLRLTDPFFEQTVGRAMTHPFNLVFRRSTPLDVLDAPARFELRPAGFIFHMSRCGSTLISQMLASLPQNVVLSEPGPIDQILRAPARLAGLTADRLAAWVRAMAAALGRSRQPDERDLFIKFEGWHVLLFGLIRRAFPDVPWVFVYRDPVEVMASLARMRPAQMLPGGIDPGLTGIAAADAADMSLDRYGALVLAQFCGAALRHYGTDGGLLIGHSELPEAVCTRLTDHFGLRYGGAELAHMRAAAQRNAKHPDAPYADDGEAKRHGASAEIRELAAEILAPFHARLEALNTARRAERQ
ncbi:MAG TPA: sulfotransferase [Xanthobacteraceae bacterium]